MRFFVFTLLIYSSLGFFIVLSSSCKVVPENPDEDYSDLESSANLYTNPPGLGLNEEYIPPRETERFAQYARLFSKIHEDQQKANQSREDDSGSSSYNFRGMHAKGHGCLKGTLTVTTADKRFQFGVFKNPGTFPIYARFSNGSGLVQSDKKRDLRGLAIKLDMGDLPQVKGAKEPGKADFLMTNAAVHHAKDIDQLMRFIEASAADAKKRALFMASNPRLTATLLSQTNRQVLTLMGETYWSRTPFQLGPDLAVKYFVKPCKTVSSVPLNGRNVEDRLKWDLMAKAKEANCFHMFVQPQTDPVKEPIENYQVEWKSPSYNVATISFPGQELDRSSVCENAVFNPWNAHVDQKPLGNFNRARLFVYEAAENFRSLKKAR